MFRLPTTLVAMTDLVVAICWAIIVAAAIDSAILVYVCSR